MRPRLVIRPTGRKMPNKPPSFQRGLQRLISTSSRRRPFFSRCWASIPFPLGSEVVEAYSVQNAQVSILTLPRGPRFMYHIIPWEYRLPDSWLKNLREVVDEICSMPPERIDSSMPELRNLIAARAEEIMGRKLQNGEIDYSGDLAEGRKIISDLAEVVCRYTVGLGLMEILLSDDHIEDVFIDAPCSSNPIHVNLGNFEGEASILRCPTNILVSEAELDGLASRLRQLSGKAFSIAFPVMETDIPIFDTRATVLGPPISPAGTALALRRRSRLPWTLTRMIHNGSVDQDTAGLLSFLIDGSSTLLIAGPRGAGKSSLLSALLFEFPLSQRILTIEDTAELPVRQMQELGFNVQSLVVEKSLGESMEVKTEEALRVSLRLGESAIVLGEVRGKEARTLYEGMRTGRAGSSVMGTIHGNSARTIYDRAVHDMGIAPEAFGATDIIVTMGFSRPHGSLRQVRSLIEIAELARERGPGEFNVVGRWDPSLGKLRIDLNNFESLRRICESWNIETSQAIANIQTRTSMRKMLVALAERKGAEFLSPAWLCRCNEFLWRRLEKGSGCESVVEEFAEWLSQRVGVESIDGSRISNAGQ